MLAALVKVNINMRYMWWAFSAGNGGKSSTSNERVVTVALSSGGYNASCHLGSI